MVEANEDAGAAARTIIARQGQLTEGKRTGIDRLARISRGPQYAKRAEDEARTRAELEETDREIAALTERLGRVQARQSSLPRAIDTWLQSIPPHVDIEMHDQVIEAQLAKGQTPIAAVEAVRSRLAELHADVHEVRSRPLPSSVAREVMRRQIAKLAAAGAPDAGGTVEIGSEVTFRTIMVHANVERSWHDVPDTIGLVCWLFQDQIVAKLDAEITEIADDEHAMTDQQRSAAERSLLAEVLAAERQEVALIELAASQGIDIAFRGDVDIRALLHLSSDLSAPARR